MGGIRLGRTIMMSAKAIAAIRIHASRIGVATSEGGVVYRMDTPPAAGGHGDLVCMGLVHRPRNATFVTSPLSDSDC